MVNTVVPFECVLEVGQTDCTVISIDSGARVCLLYSDRRRASRWVRETSTAVSSSLRTRSLVT